MIKIDLPYCKVLMIEKWNAPAGRYFIAYRSQGDYRHVLGLPVIDEFSSFSSPIFFAPYQLIGKIYNAGISLGHKRDPEMGIDLGWPPLVVGYNQPEPILPHRWEEHLLETIANAGGGAQEKGFANKGNQRIRIGECDIFETEVPLLPKQLRRICQLSDQPFAIAFSSGNRLIAAENSAPIKVQAASETVLSDILQKFSKL
jgi:hypothetical protein